MTAGKKRETILSAGININFDISNLFNKYYDSCECTCHSEINERVYEADDILMINYPHGMRYLRGLKRLKVVFDVTGFIRCVFLWRNCKVFFIKYLL